MYAAARALPLSRVNAARHFHSQGSASSRSAALPGSASSRGAALPGSASFTARVSQRELHAARVSQREFTQRDTFTLSRQRELHSASCTQREFHASRVHAARAQLHERESHALHGRTTVQQSQPPPRPETCAHAEGGAEAVPGHVGGDGSAGLQRVRVCWCLRSSRWSVSC